MVNTQPQSDTAQAPEPAKPIRTFPVATLGNECLSTYIHNLVGNFAPAFDESPQAISALKAVATALGAAGFAANQLGFYIRIMIVRLNDGVYEIMQNPILTPSTPDRAAEREGCYSLPGFSALIDRYVDINVEYINEAGESKRGLLTGAEARHAQHEYDHLNGILISDSAPFGSSKLMRIRRRFKKYGYCYTVNELGEISYK